jgi:hypothetical protein
MAFRFRKAIKLAPGVKLNLTKRGISSTSIGKKGAMINLGKKGTKQTIGIPGTGLSYQTDKSTSPFFIMVIIVLIIAFWLFGGPQQY